MRVPLEKDLEKKSNIDNWHQSWPKREKNGGKNALMNDSRDYHQLLCELGSYKDLMAGVLLQAWDTHGLTAPVESRDYVESWLDSCSASSSKYSPLV